MTEVPYCCGEKMQPIYTYRHKDGNLYRIFKCNNGFCGGLTKEVKVE